MYRSPSYHRSIFLGFFLVILPESTLAETLNKPKNTKPTKKEEVLVLTRKASGGGLMHVRTTPYSASGIDADVIARKPAAASPLQIIANLPGVNFGSSDAYGLTIRDKTTVRGLDHTEMGWSVEGMPGTNLAYYNPYVEDWADNENFSSITLIPGSSRLQDPLVTGVGGEVYATIRTPAAKREAHLDYSAGSFAAQRVFMRADSGYLGNSGIKFFTSYSYAAANNYTGSGRNRKHHFDFKMTKDWSPIANSSLFVSSSLRDVARTNLYTLKNFETANKVDNNFSEGTFASDYINGKTTNYWKSYIYTSKDVLVSLNNDVKLSGLDFKIVPYFRWEQTNAPGQTNIDPRSTYTGTEKIAVNTEDLNIINGKIPARSNTDQTMHSEGINLYTTLKAGKNNKVTVGYWLDHWTISTLNSLSPLNSSGDTIDRVLKDTSGRTIAGGDYSLSTLINQFYVSDDLSLFHDRFLISLGFKDMMYNVSGNNRLPGPQGNFSSSYSRPMPRIGLTFNVSKTVQLYFNASTNSRPAVPITTYPNIYNVATGGISQSGQKSVKPEYAVSEELGFRYHGLFNFDATLFNMNLKNHQVSTSLYLNGALTSGAISVGGETIKGATVEIASHSYYGLSAYANAQYLHATMDNNFPVSGDFLPTKGKIMVASPKFMANIGLQYKRKGFFTDITFKWVDAQYSTFMNDQGMPAYKTVDLGMGYQANDIHFLKSPYIRLNFMNITNLKYLSGIASPSYSSQVSKGIGGTSVKAGSPTYFLGTPLAIMMTVGSNF